MQECCYTIHQGVIFEFWDVDKAYIEDLFSPFANVQCKRMFGGIGIFRDGLMFALEADGVIYMKVDEHNADDFNVEELPAFTFESKRGAITLSYRQLSEGAFDDEDVLVRFARGAFDAALRNNKKG